MTKEMSIEKLFIYEGHDPDLARDPYEIVSWDRYAMQIDRADGSMSWRLQADGPVPSRGIIAFAGASPDEPMLTYAYGTPGCAVPGWEPGEPFPADPDSRRAIDQGVSTLPAVHVLKWGLQGGKEMAIYLARGHPDQDHYSPSGLLYLYRPRTLRIGCETKSAESAGVDSADASREICEGVSTLFSVPEEMVAPPREGQTATAASGTAVDSTHST